jgi:predicted RNase H-like HicB family nuclease
MAVFTALIELDPASELYVAIVPGVPGAHTQAATLDELQRNLREVLELCLEANEELRREQPKFIGLQQIEIA